MDSILETHHTFSISFFRWVKSRSDFWFLRSFISFKIRHFILLESFLGDYFKPLFSVLPRNISKGILDPSQMFYVLRFISCVHVSIYLIRVKRIMRLKVLAIFLIFLFVMLSILDAPAYVRCTDIGMCEFLDLHGHLANVLKSDIIRDFSSIILNNFFRLLENSINSKELILNFIIFCIPDSRDSFAIACPLLMGQNADLEKKSHITPFKENGLYSQNLKLVRISVIRSWKSLLI